MVLETFNLRRYICRRKPTFFVNMNFHNVQQVTSWKLCENWKLSSFAKF